MTEFETKHPFFASSLRATFLILFLDNLLALRWRENLKLWTIQWDREKREGQEKEETDDCSDG